MSYERIQAVLNTELCVRKAKEYVQSSGCILDWMDVIVINPLTMYHYLGCSAYPGLVGPYGD